MAVIKANFSDEAKDRYLTYALSVVSGRALPDVRDGLKPVQRRILYAMMEMNLKPSSSYRKCATVVGNVLGKYHPHGDSACYEAMVRMAQDFSMRYMLVDGQGNFGSLDGDSPAAYRYTEAKLREIALSVLGEIKEETVDFRDNFDALFREPVVLPSKIPNLLINGATGIAVGMATSIPPHNLKEVVQALIMLLDKPESTVKNLLSKIKGPDFPTSCEVLNSKAELQQIYETGRGSIKMRGSWEIEKQKRGKQQIVISSIPYAVNKAVLVEKIADLIINRKLPQAVDVRDESTEIVRIVIEIQADSDVENVMAFICKNTPLVTNFNVNLTALVPADNVNAVVPEQLNLLQILNFFLDFRKSVVKRRLEFEQRNLAARLHILEGFMLIFDDLDEAIRIVRSSSGRSDAASKLAVRFKLSELQSFAIVDLRIYQLSRTNIDEIRAEYAKISRRLSQIAKVLKSPAEIANLVKLDLESVVTEFGDKRRSQIIKDHTEFEINADAFVVKEEVYTVITKDGWIKRIRQTNELTTTRVREGDSILFAHPLNTIDSVLFITSLGNIYSLVVTDFPASSGYGDPVQKYLKFKDGEKIISSCGITSDLALGHAADYQFYYQPGDQFYFVSKNGLGYSTPLDEGILDLKKSGKRVMKLKANDLLVAAGKLQKKLSIITRRATALTLKAEEVLERNSPAVGVTLIKLKKLDYVQTAYSWQKNHEVELHTAKKTTKAIELKKFKTGKRAQSGGKLPFKSEIVAITNKETGQ